MGVGYKGMRYFQQLGRPKCPDLTNIKEQSPMLPENLHIERRVSEGIIDQFGVKQRFQMGSSLLWES
jgi:hypothetical protein